MLWNVCFFACIAVILATAVVAVWMLVSHRGRVGKLTVLHLLIAACFIVAVLLCIPPHHAAYGQDDLGGLKNAVMSVLRAIRLFAADEDYDVIYETVGAVPEWMVQPYLALTMVTLIMAPLLTFGFVLSFFKNISAYIRYLLGYFRDMYVFSELNERSLALAEDIRQNHEEARIVFANVFDGSEDDDELIQTAREMGAICFKKDILSVDFSRHATDSAIYFFAMGHEQARNVEQALKLIDTYNDRENTHLYLFADSTESELLLAGAKKGKMKVRRVNEVRSLITRILYEEGHKIFERAVPAEDGQRHIGAVIVGMGGHGTEMVKALSWYCQMDGYRIHIDAFDREEKTEDRFAALCPELLSPKYNSVYVPGEAEYRINIHSDMDVTTKTFADEIMKLKDTTYVLVSLGSDEDNIRTAANLRMLFERNGAKPMIQTIVYSTEAKKALQCVTNNAGQPYALDLIGDIRSSYSEKVIIDSEVEEDAFSRHKAYAYGDPDKEADFWRYEYCYRSSIATTVHAEARKKCGIPGAGKREEDMTEEERRIMGALEHRRWNAYMRSEGFIYSGSPERSSRNDLGKMHHNLVDYEQLSDADKNKDHRVGQK